jgi:hypothetical protein
MHWPSFIAGAFVAAVALIGGVVLWARCSIDRMIEGE